ncbi:hypothetical protein HELRODRAFT_101461 [Helobdella robusta]|uniref:Uncharacterized protein n=1 Tax=Helobdella robusta TaxID=6412 RepID=T1ED47_HELRO|nr:hypothetical protein HELRODRAFT_101461 [Helobdella robusta]ESN99844.1 hypothetical protein HELRODRAFT_101461 [Helobdella robusta]
MSNFGKFEFKWNTEDFEIRTKSVEKTLEPLINHVTTLMQDSPSRVKKGQSKKAQTLIAAVQMATENFIMQGEMIASEYPEVQKDMLKIIQDVRNSGGQLCQSSLEFSQAPCSSESRVKMVQTARTLLRDVTRLLILADMVDVFLLLRSLQIINGDIDRISSAQNNQELTNCMDHFNENLNEVNQRTGSRQMDLKDERRREDLAAARAVLKKSSVMLFTTTKTHVRHPELQAARSNRDFVLGQVREAVKDISNVAMETGSHRGHDPSRKVKGDIANALDEFENQIIMDPMSYSENRTRPRLEAMLEKIIGRAAMLADGTSTRDERRDKIIRECQNLRSALQNLLSEYLYSVISRNYLVFLGGKINQVYGRTRCLRKHLNRSVSDHVSDCFLDTDMPLLLMLEAAKDGDHERMEAYAGVFVEHANKLIEVSQIACSMCTNEDGIRMVSLACDQLQKLCPQVVNACRTLCSHPRSSEAAENAEAFKEAWLKQLTLLTDAVDDLVSLDDFLAVSEQHILEDINQCVLALQNNDPTSLDETSGRIRGRCQRICDVTEGEMMSFLRGGEGNQYVDRVMECVMELRKQIIVRFTNQMSATINALNSNTPVDENGFVQASNLVYEGVQNVRRAVLNDQNVGDYDSDLEDEAEFEKFSKNAALRKSRRQDNVVFEEDSDRARMRALPEEERNKIQQQVLESATSLIQAAKNLMNAVVLAVRSSYVASTKYPKAGSNLNITWRMKAPEKKPLVQRETLEDMRAKVRRGDSKKTIEPIKALSEFQA